MSPKSFDAAHLILENGSVFKGMVPQWQDGISFGEVVFTTGMTGYPESLTDPSYAGQILTFTYPLIGNYGVPDPKYWESTKIYAAGVVVGNVCQNWSHHRGLHSLVEWLHLQKIPLITGVDTRALTKMLRHSGTMPGAITKASPKKIVFPDIAVNAANHWVSEVSSTTSKIYGKGKKRIIAIDCGMKENIIRAFSQFPVTIKRVPHDYDFTNEDYDGIFISNGPGDPTACSTTISHLKTAIQQEKPIFGICLGIQLLALAAGAKTYKLPFGHRGQNQPCIDTQSHRCYITSQNHGYAVLEKSIPKDWLMTFKNLNDGSVEGIEHKTKPFFAVQFHPESAPGPTDTMWLFEKFIKTL